MLFMIEDLCFSDAMERVRICVYIGMCVCMCVRMRVCMYVWILYLNIYCMYVGF